jgi:transposase-like protein
MTQPGLFKWLKTNPEIIRLAVMLYVRFPLSLRNVEDLLHERGACIPYKSVTLVEKVGRQSHPLRHLPQRKRSPHPAAAGFFRCFGGLCGWG